MPLRIKLLISVVAVELLRCLGGWINSCQISDWYAALNKPVGNLPYQTFASALNPRQAVDLQKGSADQVSGGTPISPGTLPSDPDRDRVIIVRKN